MRNVAFLSIASLLLAGCAGDMGSQTTPPTHMGLLAGPSLWDDPQNAPHPAYGWATLSNPPAGEVPQWWKPIPAAQMPETVTGLKHLSTAQGIAGGAGIAIFGSVAVVPTFSQGENTVFVDISDPANPALLGAAGPSGRGAAVIAYPDGRLVAAVATGAGFSTIDFTNPREPVLLNDTAPTLAGHKVGVVPGTPILYNAASKGTGSQTCRVDVSTCTQHTAIYDLTDPSAPVLVQEFANGLSCHHIFFWISQNQSRAICSGFEYTQIWDIADPLQPKVLVNVPFHHGMVGVPSTRAGGFAFSHSAGLSRDGTILYVGDESGGGGTPPGCVASVETPLGSLAVPVGAVWFYDVSSETNPRYLGHYSPSNDPGVSTNPDPARTARSCTAHHGRLVPDGDRDLLAMSFYKAGVVLIDFTDVGSRQPHAIAQFADGTDTWETWYYNGYLFTGDLARGFEAFTLT